MAMYDNRRAGAPIRAVEFSPMPDGNFTFVYLNDKLDADGAKKTLSDLGQNLITETLVNGKPVLVTQGAKSQTDILSALQNDGNVFALRPIRHKVNLWKVRGGMGTVGQLGQLASSLMPSDGHIDYATLVFAVSNLTANGINMAFGGEKVADTHQLHFLKEQFNEQIGPHVAAGSQLPDAHDDTRAQLRAEPERPKSIGKKFHDFMQRNSVVFGEIGLRYFGSFALAFPISKKWHENLKDPTEITRKTISLEGWGKGIQGVAKGDFKQAYVDARNPDTLTRRGGLTYMGGKTIAFMSKIPDPYDPKPHTWWDTVREHVTFHLSSAIETCAGATIAYDRLFNRTIKIPENWKFIPEYTPNWKIIPKNMPDWKILKQRGQPLRGARLRGAETMDVLGGVGGMLFAAAYITRFFAPFGEKQLDMNELKAHVSDSLANVKPEEVPKLLADCAATIKEHAKDKPIEFGQIYTSMLTDLYQYQHVVPPGTTPEQGGKNKPLVVAERGDRPRSKLGGGPREVATLETLAAQSQGRSA